MAGRVGGNGLRSLDLRSGQGAALGDVNAKGMAGLGTGGLRGLGARVAAGALRTAGVAIAARLGGGLGGRLRRLVGGNIKDVQAAASGRLDSRGLTRVVGAVVAIDNVVVPVPLASLEDRAGEAEGALPRARLGRGLVLGERELANIVVPGTEKMNGLDARGGADGERQLSSGHFGFFFSKRESN